MTNGKRGPVELILAFFAAGNILNAFWMLAAPPHWYENLPAGVPDFGPMNEHFIRDIGSLFLLMGVALAYVAVRPRHRLPVVVGVAGVPRAARRGPRLRHRAGAGRSRALGHGPSRHLRTRRAAHLGRVQGERHPRMTRLRWVGAVVVGLYLFATPFLRYWGGGHGGESPHEPRRASRRTARHGRRASHASCASAPGGGEVFVSDAWRTPLRPREGQAGARRCDDRTAALAGYRLVADDLPPRIDRPRSSSVLANGERAATTFDVGEP